MEDLLRSIPVFSDEARSLDSHAKERYLQNISLVYRVDPAALTCEQFSPECLPPVEVSDLLWYLVLETSHYTDQTFRAYKSCQEYKWPLVL